jgi:hypothetical protein
MTPEEERWYKRVAARVLGGRIKEFRAWLQTDNGQLALIAAITVFFMIAGVVDGVMKGL